jgi:hypothetical protein
MPNSYSMGAAPTKFYVIIWGESIAKIKHDLGIME